jgi:phytoene dehydrogenase-like protein
MRTANIIGSGPNGLAAAITLAQLGVKVTVFERNASIGGACSTAELTLPGFRHDVGSSCYPFGIASPFFKSLPLAEHGLRWIEPPAALAHPMADGTAATLEHDIDRTSAQFTVGADLHDACAWRRLLTPFVKQWPLLLQDILKPLPHFPGHPIVMARLAAIGLVPATILAKVTFRHESARLLFAGCAAHSSLPLSHMLSSATGLLFAAAGHTTGWPIVAGGAGALTNALAQHLRQIGGEIVTSRAVESLRDCPEASVTLFDTSAEALSRIAGDSLSFAYRKKLSRFRLGPGIFKVDYALSEPIPWRSRECERAATVHLGASVSEIAGSEHFANTGHVPAREADRPFVLLVQPSLFDPTRAPDGKHTAWAYCHVPLGSDEDRTEGIDRQIERFAPGFRDTVLARKVWSARDLANWNPNLAGGNVTGGAMDLRGTLVRPTSHTYRTSNPKLYLCSSSTPPGGGVHGMCGYNAAIAAARDHLPGFAG